MQRLFFPQRVAVIGVSPSPTNLGKNIVHNLQHCGFDGQIYAVGPRGGTVYGLDILPAVEALPGGVDCAVLLVPAAQVPTTLEQCGRKGIPYAIISSGGFAEYRAHQDLDVQLQAIASRYGLRFIGPNCIGIINLENGLCTPFNTVQRETLRPGPHSLLSQSGGVMMHCAALLSEAGVGFSKLVSMGNKLNLDEVDLLQYLATDAQTRVILLYLESISRGRALMEAIRACPKPVVVLKANISPLTHRIAHSHTAALASDERIVDAALRQAGALRVWHLSEFVTAARAFALPPLRGPRLAVLSMSGGLAVIAADLCATHGFDLPALPTSLLQALEARRRGGVIALTNPLDFGDIYDLRMMQHTVEQLVQLDIIDGVVASVPYSPRLTAMIPDAPDAATLLTSLATAGIQAGKPVALSLMASHEAVRTLRKQVPVPLFDTIDEAIAGLAMQYQYWRCKKCEEPLGYEEISHVHP